MSFGFRNGGSVIEKVAYFCWTCPLTPFQLFLNNGNISTVLWPISQLSTIIRRHIIEGYGCYHLLYVVARTGSSLRVATGILPPRILDISKRTRATSRVNRCFASVNKHFDAEVMPSDKVTLSSRATRSGHSSRRRFYLTKSLNRKGVAIWLHRQPSLKIPRNIMMSSESYRTPLLAARHIGAGWSAQVVGQSSESIMTSRSAYSADMSTIHISLSLLNGTRKTALARGLSIF